MGILYQQPAPVINLEGALFQTTAVHNYCQVCHAAKIKIKKWSKSSVFKNQSVFFVLKHNTKPDAIAICKS